MRRTACVRWLCHQALTEPRRRTAKIKQSESNIYCLLSKLVSARWLDINLAFFVCVVDLLCGIKITIFTSRHDKQSRAGKVYLHLARLGSQSQRRIWLIFRASGNSECDSSKYWTG